MIVFDLACGTGHRFEAWFRSGESFDEQAAAGALACPFCRDTHIVKAPMAPRVVRGVQGGAEPASTPEAARPGAQQKAHPEVTAQSAPATSTERPGSSPEALMQTLVRLRETIEATCEDVGPRFAEEARRIHFGETEQRGIYGEASADEAAALRDDGIVCQALPWWQRRDD